MQSLEIWQILAIKVVFALMMIGAVMTMAGYSVLAERKVSAWMQGRVGPNRTVLPHYWEYSDHWLFPAGFGNFSTSCRRVEILIQRRDRSGTCK